MNPDTGLRLLRITLLSTTVITSAATAAPSTPQTLSGHVPPTARTAQAVGALAGTTKLQLAVGLPLRHQAELDQLLHDLYDPGSAQYRQYLSPEQFTARFGPTEEDYQAVIAFARANGFEVTALHPNRLLVDVKASVADIEKALHVQMRVYQHPRETRTFYAPANEPTLDLAVPVLHISGLDNFVLPRPAGLKVQPPRTGSGPEPQVGSGPGGSYRGNDFRAAYVRGLTLNGAGQFVGLVQFDGYYPNDIASYLSQAGLAAVPLINVVLDGFSGSPGVNNIEVALDIEVSISMAPGLAGVIVYEGLVPNDILSRMATDNLAKQLSASWTFPVDGTTSQIFQQFAAQGQSYFNASGDAGAYTGPISTPADDPYVSVVGGTTLSTSSAGGPWTSETAWNWATTGSGTNATAGGISTRYAIPTWQQGISMAANGGSTTMRNIPDVALVGDNTYVVYNNGSSTVVGGTSVSSPLWAGFMALVNQQAASIGQPSIGFINPIVYAIGKGAGYSTNFHDITTGNNTNLASPTRFYAVAGYDLCTGWGTPNGTNLINTLAPRPNVRLVTNVTANITSEGCLPANGAIDPGETVTVSLGLKNLGAARTTNLVGTLLADGGVTSPSSPQSYGILLGGGITVNRSFSFTANGICGSNLVARLQLQDGTANLGTQAFSFTLGRSIAVVTQNFDSVTAPALPGDWSTAVFSNGVPWITSTSSRDTTPNAAYGPEPVSPGISELVSPIFPIATTSAQLIFRHFYNFEADPTITNRGYDGGVLEMQIGAGPFTDIIAAGGSFAVGGYTKTLDATNDNPLAGRQAWSGLSPGFITTVVNLPAAAAGQAVQLKWRLGTDTGNAYGGLGWYVDSILVADGYACCNAIADLGLTQSVSPDPAILSSNITYSIFVTNAGPQQAFGVKVVDTLSTNVSFVSASGSGTYANGAVTFNFGTMPNNWLSAASVTVMPLSEAPVTNLLTLTALTPDPNPGDNILTSVTTVSGNAAPAIVTQPADVVTVQGSNATFQVTATGVPAPGYQWTFNGTNLANATDSMLSLTNVQADQMGGYSVLATNVVGSITSSVARLTVLVRPQIQLAGLLATPTNVSIMFGSLTGLNYTLEYKNSLSDTTWFALPPSIPGTGGSIVLQDTNGAVLPSRFYRINCHP